MKISAEITFNRELNLTFDFPENTGQTTNVWVAYLRIFNTRSYLDGISVYEKTFDEDMDQNETTPPSNPITHFTISEHDINIFESIMHDVELSSGCYSTDLMNDIMTVEVTLGYSTEYIANSSCCNNTPRTKTIVIYNSCGIYDQAVKSITGCDCKDMCEENLPYGFMYTMLKKKAVDSCLGSMHLDMACRYFLKFFKND